ncbi:hypothetical protein E2C01_102531 [Portunus trituberculatus]|uniref:Uncharacterized protein n=1 Tax=Portunus trituberculatus TaxID=210409 RepID=A0A5B7KIR5_PORTR|nr:hypothetical protein [Portunus trituberculatus]
MHYGGTKELPRTSTTTTTTSTYYWRVFSSYTTYYVRTLGPLTSTLRLPDLLPRQPTEAQYLIPLHGIHNTEYCPLPESNLSQPPTGQR